MRGAVIPSNLRYVGCLLVEGLFCNFKLLGVYLVIISTFGENVSIYDLLYIFFTKFYTKLINNNVSLF